jgi:hypothetical protein
MKAKFGDSLVNLAMLSGVDKQRGLESHGYVKYYDQLFSSFRNDDIKLFEIGIARGRSHLMWTYYFPQGHIYGIDTEADELSRYLEFRGQHLDRLHMEQMDQADSAALKAFAEENGPFDVVIDDGSHKAEHQILSYETLLPFTKKYYVIEDLHPGYWVENKSNPESFPAKHPTVEYFRAVVENQINRQGASRAFDIDHAPKEQIVEWVMFVPSAIIIKIR